VGRAGRRLLALRLADFEHSSTRSIRRLRWIERRDGSVRSEQRRPRFAIERSRRSRCAFLVASADSADRAFRSASRTIRGSLAPRRPAAGNAPSRSRSKTSSTCATRLPDSAEAISSRTLDHGRSARRSCSRCDPPVGRGGEALRDEEFARRHGDFAIAGAAVRSGDGDDER